MSGRLSVVVGGQAGSEAKGHVTGWLTHQDHRWDGERIACVRVAGPNAGHSAYGIKDGKVWALRQVPVAAVTNLDAHLYIAAGSEIDLAVLQTELSELDAAGYNVTERLTVDAEATWLEPEHLGSEVRHGLTERIGSTSKGVGAARAARLMRIARTIAYAENENMLPPGVRVARGTGLLLQHMLTRSGFDVVIEGTQGYVLGLHAGFYPYCTSSDCRAIDFIAMVGLSPWALPERPDVWVVVRPYPIRVAGNSGPMADETSWDELGLDAELTTVTKKIRRVGRWDPVWVRDAVAANGQQVRLAFSMADQVAPSVAGQHGPRLDSEWLSLYLSQWRDRILSAAGDGSSIDWVGTGPGTSVWRPEVFS